MFHLNSTHFSHSLNSKACYPLSNASVAAWQEKNACFIHSPGLAATRVLRAMPPSVYEYANVKSCIRIVDIICTHMCTILYFTAALYPVGGLAAAWETGVNQLETYLQEKSC